MPPLVIAGLALAAGKVVKGIIDKSKASKINAQYTPYQESPYAEEQLGTARQMFNGRMAGAATEERNIDKSQGSYNDFVDKNASSGAQALALGATGQARSNQAYSDLAVKEQQNKYGLLSNLNMAYQNMTNEQDKVWQSKNQKYLMDINQKRSLNSAGDQNIFGGISDGISLGMGNGGFGSVESGGSLDAFKSGTSFGNEMNAINPYSSPAMAYGSSIPSSGGLQLWYPPMKQNG